MKDVTSKFDMQLTATRIRELRDKLDLNQQELAEKAHIASESISRYERKNPRVPKIDILGDLADALECEPDYLLGRINHPKRSTSEISDLIPLSREAIEALEKLGDALNEYSESDSVLVTSILNDLIINYVESISAPMSIDLSTLSDGEKFEGYDVQVIEEGLFTDASEMLTACETVSDFQHNDISKVTPSEYQYARLAIRGIRTSIGDRLSDIVAKSVMRLAESRQRKELEV